MGQYKAEEVVANKGAWGLKQGSLKMTIPNQDLTLPTSHSNPTDIAVTVVSSLRWRGLRR